MDYAPSFAVFCLQMSYDLPYSVKFLIFLGFGLFIVMVIGLDEIPQLMME